MLDAVGVAHEARIGRELRRAEHCDKARELRIVADGDDDVAVGDRKHLVGHDVRMRVAHPARRHARDEIAHRLVGEHADLRVEERHVDMAPSPGLVAAPERGEDRDRGIDPGENVGIGDADLLRLAVRLAGQVHDAAHALDHEVVAGARAHRGRPGRSR